MKTTIIIICIVTGAVGYWLWTLHCYKKAKTQKQLNKEKEEEEE